MPATDFGPGLIFSLAFLATVLAVLVVPILYFIWRIMRTTRQENSQLLTAVLALSQNHAAIHLAGVRADAEAKDVAAHPEPIKEARQPRPRAVGAGG